MFERICFDQRSGWFPLDLGPLAEAMIFYGRVQVIANRAVLTRLAERVGPTDLVRLAESELVELRYCGVRSRDVLVVVVSGHA